MDWHTLHPFKLSDKSPHAKEKMDVARNLIAFQDIPQMATTIHYINATKSSRSP